MSTKKSVISSCLGQKHKTIKGGLVSEGVYTQKIYLGWKVKNSDAAYFLQWEQS